MINVVSINYNQTVPAHVLNRHGRGIVSPFREPCMKIIAGDADNAKLQFADEVQAKRGQDACREYIHRHDMNLRARTDGNDLYILRKS
ncbi:MAG: hypothetical protein IJ418_16735 [Clostridia bacterium]|nr:hypothetical protein [Clostridia bacterium]